MQIGGDGHAGGIRFDHIQAGGSGTYELEILYVRNGLEDKMLSVSVNGAASLSVRAIMRSWNVVTLPVPLHTGDNSIAVTYTGTLPLDLDRIALVRASQQA